MQVKTCVEDVGSSAMMFLLIVHSQHTNDWMVSYDKVDKYHLYCARRSRKGAMLTRWHWHPVEGGWRSRVRCRV